MKVENKIKKARIKRWFRIKKYTIKCLVMYLLMKLWEFLNKNRHIQSYKKKKAILIIVFVLIDCYVLNNLIEGLKILDFKKVYIYERVVESVSTNVVADSPDSRDGTEGDILPSTVEESIEDKICKVFPDNCDVMVAIAKAESGLKTDAIGYNKNGSIDVGLFQINSVHRYSTEELFDTNKNLEIAKKIYDKQGITAWASFNNGKYIKFLKS
jgi:hypothetical protein